MASPMIRVPEALKEVIQKLADIYRQGDQRREVEAGLHRLLADLVAQATLEASTSQDLNVDSPLDSEIDDTNDNEIASKPDNKSDDKVDSKSDSISESGPDASSSSQPNPDSKSDSKSDDKIDDKIDSKSVVTSDNINVEDVVSRLVLLEEKLAAIEVPLARIKETAEIGDPSDVKPDPPGADQSEETSQG